WAEDLVEEAEGLDERTRHKAQFYLKQLSSALSPSNFLLTNPELIQYAPATETVLRRPLLIVPPWINKFYVLDLNPEKSFIRWAVSQGLTVFVISWVNPDARHAEKGFGDYMREGIFAALDAVEAATGERKVTTIGYCVGGTLLAVALAHMAATGDDRVESATFLTTQVDFKHAGDLKVFVDEEQLTALEEGMQQRGYLEGSRMANAFNMLRPNDLIWPYMINNYLKGRAPMPFDLLYWNSDSTRMPAANHAFYMRNCYLENKLTKGEMVLENVRLDLKKVKIPIFNLAAKEDHIAPALSVFDGSKAFGGKVDYVMAGSGHIAGVVNPMSKPKYQFWTGGPPKGKFEDWVAKAEEHPGSWWPYWFAWVDKQNPERVPAREPGGGKLTPICDAPGEYVKAKA
ncbi:MAG: PHA/PHB synthase family protein, partial [Microvirga sp.]